ncbi:MAG: diphthine--ammonia ligase [Candidatus Diapherotrites archaeon]
MCGIVGVFKNPDSRELVEKGLEILKARGIDGKGIEECGKGSFMGHRLHSVVGKVKQPLKGSENGILAANSEIYNWKELAVKYGIPVKNDSELLLKLIEKKGAGNFEEILNMLDGVYAFAYCDGKRVFVARDLLGVKPLWISTEKGFAFASERKALWEMGFPQPLELEPRQIAVYDLESGKIKFIDREFFSITPEIKDKKERIKENLKELIADAVKKRIAGKKMGLLFSGGVDSSLLALVLKEMGVDFTCYTAALEEKGLKMAKDLDFAERAAKEMGLKLKVVKVSLKEVEALLPEIVNLLESSNVVTVGVGLTMYLAARQAKEDGAKVIFSGMGSDDLFAGYNRFVEGGEINKDCLSYMRRIHSVDLYRDDIATMANSVELRLPYLDRALVDYSLRIPGKFKMKDGNRKLILRELASEMGMKNEFAYRKKTAAQYGSSIDKALSKLAKKKGMKSKSYYLDSLFKRKIFRLGALVSGGKDSIYAMQIMHEHNYSIECIISVKSRNPDSFMFHTPAIELVEMQAEAMGIPLISVESEGEKERELEDLKKAVEKAKEKFNLDGIVTGAIFSNYQRTRIEEIATKSGLKIYAPLWHMNQEILMRELVKEGFEFVITAIASKGLGEEWLGKRIGGGEVDKILELAKKEGFNPAGEGGEFETLVLDAPMFKKRIELVNVEKNMGNELSGRLVVKKARLVEK